MEGLIMINLKKNIWMFHTFDWQTPMTVIVQTMLKNCSDVGSNLLVQLCYISFWKGFPRQICFKLQNQCKHSSYLVPVTSLRIKFNVSCISVFTSIMLISGFVHHILVLTPDASSLSMIYLLSQRFPGCNYPKRHVW